MTPDAVAATAFTPTERRIVDVLADGFAHTRRELRGCLDDELAETTTLKVHVHNIRKKLPRGLGVLCEVNGGLKYRMVQFVGGRGE